MKLPADSRRLHGPALSLLSLLWLFPSLGACWIIGAGLRRWLAANEAARANSVVWFEEWVALAILAVQLTLVGLALRAKRIERQGGRGEDSAAADEV